MGTKIAWYEKDCIDHGASRVCSSSSLCQHGKYKPDEQTKATTREERTKGKGEEREEI